MPTYRHDLPQLNRPLFLADGGLETSLIFDQGVELPDFAAFMLLRSDEGRAALARYFGAYVDLARRLRVGVVLETATWRANPDWAARRGVGLEELARLDAEAVDHLVELRGVPSDSSPVVISGCVGPRGDGYRVDRAMSAEEAAAYHSAQVRAFAESEADLVTAMTMTHVGEGLGVVEAARRYAVPVVVSFTVETDGNLPSGERLRDAIDLIDAETDGYPAYYMINCAHPDHFAMMLEPEEPWTRRLGGLRANASRMSHAELDAAPTLDAGDPAELAVLYRELRHALPALRVLGGCCGTNHEHVEAIGAACGAT